MTCLQVLQNRVITKYKVFGYKYQRIFTRSLSLLVYLPSLQSATAYTFQRANVHKSSPQMSRRGGYRDKGLILIYCRVRIRFDPPFTMGDTAETGSAASEG